MPFYRRGYYRRGRSGYGYRGYNRSWRRRGWYRRGGLSRASSQGNRRFSVIVPTQASFNFTVAAGQYWSDLWAVCPYSGLNANKLMQAGLPSSLLYRTYTRIYDQVKVDWVSVKISIMSLVGAGGVSPAVKIVTMWDRSVTYDDISSNEPGGIPTTDSISNGSESQTSLIVNNSRAVVNRFNGASDLQERTLFHDCSLEALGGMYYDSCWRYGQPVGYAPGIFIALNTATSPGENTTFSFTCSLDVKYHVTFRNPKFGLTSSGQSKSGGDLTSEPVVTKGAGKSVAKTIAYDAGELSGLLPAYNGLLGDVVDRLKLNMNVDDVYGDGVYSHDEDVKFAYEKLGDEKFHEEFKNVYDISLKELGLIVDKKDGDVLIKEA